MGLPQSTVARWEAGDHEPSLASVERALSACGLTLAVTVAIADDSYDHQIAQQLALTPHGKLVVVPGAGHSVQSRAVSDVGCKAVARFLLGS